MDGALTKDEIEQLLTVNTVNTDGSRKPIQVLSQDDVDQLLTAINAGKPGNSK